MFGTGVHCFLLTAETLSFSETARQLGISQQAVSKNIFRLEQKLGLTLFVRSHRKLELTPAGQSCCTIFKDTSAQLQRNLAALRAKNQQSPHTLSVGYQNYVELTGLLSDGIAQINRAHENLTVVCESHSPAGLVDGLMSGRLDVILICQRFLPENIRVQTAFLSPLPLLLLFSSSFPLAGENFNVLRRAPLIIDRLESETPAAIEQRIAREISRVELAPERVIIAPNRDSAYSAAELGQGVVLSTSLSRFLFASGMQFCHTGASDSLICCWRPRADNPLAAEFAQVLQSAVTENKGQIPQI